MDTQLSPLPLPSQLPEPQPAEAASSTTSMPLPPEAIYSSKEELYASIQAWAAQYYYAFIIGRSNKIHKGPRIKIFYNCDRYKPPPPDNHPQNYLQCRQRHTTTRKTNCQFSVVAIQYTDTQWELHHRPGVASTSRDKPG
jgi:hypothetical protein